MSLEHKIKKFESYEIPGEERCAYAVSCKRNCDGYIMKDGCKRYDNYQKKKTLMWKNKY
jgi:hypothetical protein